MALTIAQVTDFRTIVPTDINSDLGFRPGYQINNTTSGGVAMICKITNKSFGQQSGCASMNVLVLSGTFSNADVCTTTPSSSGFTISTVTAAAHAGIQVTGTMSDTDSTRNTNEALDDSEVDITCTSTTGIVGGDIIRIENEYCLVEIVSSSTVMLVKRGLYGTVATHTTGQDIYIVDTNLYKQIYDADVSGSWGYSDCSTGKLRLDCHLVLGTTNQGADSVLISAGESVDISETATNYIFIFGNGTYETHYQDGIGYISDVSGEWDGFSSDGSRIYGVSASNYFTPFINSNSYLFSTNINIDTHFRGAVFSYNLFLNQGSIFENKTSSKMFNTNINLTGPVFQTELIDIKQMYVKEKAVNWIFSYGAFIVRELETDIRVADEGFFAGGDKTYIDCKCSPYSAVFGASVMDFYNYKSFNATVVDELGEPLEDVTITCNYRGTSTANVFSVTTDADGDITEQLVLFLYVAVRGPGGFTGPTATLYPTRDIEYFIRKSGYKEIRGRINIQDMDDPIVLRKVLKKNKFRETKSRGSL